MASVGKPRDEDRLSFGFVLAKLDDDSVDLTERSPVMRDAPGTGRS